jgi:hypothetical protein
LIKAALFQSSIFATTFDPLRDRTFGAIRTLHAAIQRSASSEEGERPLLDAIHAAEKWAEQQ